MEPATGPASVVQQPEHGKARRTAEVIGAPSSIQGEVRANNSMEPTRPAYSSRLLTHAPPNNSFNPALASESLIIKLRDFCYLVCNALASGGLDTVRRLWAKALTAAGLTTLTVCPPACR